MGKITGSSKVFKKIYIKKEEPEDTIVHKYNNINMSDYLHLEFLQLNCNGLKAVCILQSVRAVTINARGPNFTKPVKHKNLLSTYKSC